MITFKYKRPTRKEFGHTKVYSDGKYIGYFMRNVSKFSVVGENWNFVSLTALSEPKYFQSFYARNRKELINKIEKQENKEPVVLKQGFGVVAELNF